MAEAIANDWREEDGGKAGLWLFLLSEALLFGAFISSYLGARLGSADCALGVSVWPEAGHGTGLALAALNTVVLLTSSYAMARAVSRGERGDVPGLRANLGAAAALGALFLAVKGAEYAYKIGHGWFPGSPQALAAPGLSIFLSYYYALTSLHALHVVAGLAWMLLLLRGSSGLPAPVLSRRAEYAGLYWHFVDVVWVILFPLLYLI